MSGPAPIQKPTVPGYYPAGGLRLSTGSLPTDRLLTGQTRDLGNDAYYFFKSRYYDATIGRFHTPDSTTADPKNPQAANRYSYALNNPLRLVVPSGHDAMDPDWRAKWTAEDPGKTPSEQDWEGYQLSTSVRGSGANGTWTDADWGNYQSARQELSTLGASAVAKFRVFVLDLHHYGVNVAAVFPYAAYYFSK
jgi:RHS repeat-associated protein